MNVLDYINKKYNVPPGKRSFYLKGQQRKDLYILFKELGYTEGCEVGVCKGRNARNILNTIPDLKLHCVDFWAPTGKRTARRQNQYYRQMKQELKKYRINGQAHIIKKSSMDAVKDFENESLDFVYIDADHRFDFVIRDIIEWTHKVRISGIVSGHDFYKSSKFGVVDAVTGYVRGNNIKHFFVMDREDPIVRSNGSKKKRSPRNSWFFVKI